MKIADLDIAKHYGVTTRTITNYKNGDKEKQELYNAMRYYLEYPPQNKSFKEMSIEELHNAHETVTNQMMSDVDNLQIITDFIKEKNE